MERVLQEKEFSNGIIIHDYTKIRLSSAFVLLFNYSISQEICTRFFALLCFVVVIHWLIFPYPSGLLHWHCGNLTIAPVSAKQPWWIWINTSFEFIMNDYKATTKQSTTKPCAYFLGYTVRDTEQYMLLRIPVDKFKETEGISDYFNACKSICLKHVIMFSSTYRNIQIGYVD